MYDVLVDDNEIFISFVKEIESCRKIYVSSSNINLKNLNFKNIFISETCNKDASPGRMQILNKNDNKGLIMSISSGAIIQSDESQNENSITGKLYLLIQSQKILNIFKGS